MSSGGLPQVGRDVPQNCRFGATRRDVSGSCHCGDGKSLGFFLKVYIRYKQQGRAVGVSMKYWGFEGIFGSSIGVQTYTYTYRIYIYTTWKVELRVYHGSIN